MPDMLFAKPNRPPAPDSASLNATQIVAGLAHVSGWRLDGEGPQVAIEKSFRFADFAECLGFVNALGWVVRQLGHAPARASIESGSEVRVRWSTPAVGGLCALDFEAARQTDALLG